MSEHPMETTWRTALWQQFGAAIDMLENALVACPETLWQGHLWIDSLGPEYGTFWDITYHTLYWLDLYLTGRSVEAFTPPAPFKKRSDAVTPTQPYTRDELHTYLKHLRQKCQSTIAELSDEQAYQPFHFPWDSDNPISYGELQLYTLRHGPRTCGPTEPLSRTAWHPW
jgi:DinB superfamily